MSIDIFQSRRNYNERCRWWSRLKSERYDDNSLIMKRIPTGEFMAREVSPEQIRHTIIANTFLFPQGTITIKTPDNIMGIKADDLVEYQDECWIVSNVQKSKARIQNSYYAKDKYCSHFWYIELRK